MEKVEQADSAGGSENWYMQFAKVVGLSSVVNMYLPCDSAIPLLDSD